MLESGTLGDEDHHHDRHEGEHRPGERFERPPRSVVGVQDRLGDVRGPVREDDCQDPAEHGDPVGAGARLPEEVRDLPGRQAHRHEHRHEPEGEPGGEVDRVDHEDRHKSGRQGDSDQQPSLEHEGEAPPGVDSDWERG